MLVVPPISLVEYKSKYQRLEHRGFKIAKNTMLQADKKATGDATSSAMHEFYALPSFLSKKWAVCSQLRRVNYEYSTLETHKFVNNRKYSTGKIESAQKT